MKRNLLFLVVLTLFSSCKKDVASTSNPNSTWSNWTLVGVKYSGYYDADVQESTEWNSAHGIYNLSVYGWDETDTNGYMGNVYLFFNRIPTSSRVYKISRAESLTDSTCYITAVGQDNTLQYSSNRNTDIVNVSVSNGNVTASFSNVSLVDSSMFTLDSVGTGIISGNIIQHY
jgi:hypothetical protein